MTKAALFLREIRIEHTLFALPFAYVGAIFAARGLPAWTQILWITLAVLGARTAAMAANRYFDRDIDARNPRTARRAVASGLLSPTVMIWAIVIGFAVLLLSAWMLNPLCVKLMPIAAVLVLLYPLCKRFTWLVHFVLGAVDALAPLGAYIGITGRVDEPAIWLFIAVTLWVAGFDILYALMDIKVDREQGISSLPARVGEGGSIALFMALHAFTAGALYLAGATARASDFRTYLFGVAAMVALFVYEYVLLRTSKNVFVLNERVFVANMAFSVIFMVTTFLSFRMHA